MSYTRSTARSLAVSAAGLALPRPPRARSRAEARRRALVLVSRLGYVQLDSVNVLARAQDMVLFSRLGALPPDLLTVPVRSGPPDLVEQWAHEAAVVTPGVARLLCAFPRQGLWGSRVRHLRDPEWKASLMRVMERLASSPATALEVADEFAGQDRERRHLFETCALHAFHSRSLVGVGRTAAFQRLLADPAHLWPDWSQDAAPTPEGSTLELTRVALRGLGIARTSTVADWFRLSRTHTAGALERLESLGEARRVEVSGTRTTATNPWWVPTDADEGGAGGHGSPDTPLRTPTRRDRVRLVSPFDHLVAHRPRLEELFGVHYRIGIYTPADKREFGYYDLLVLLGDEIVGRIDLRAERTRGELLVRGFWLETSHARAPMRTARVLLPELRRVAAWQGVERVTVEEGARGDGAAALMRVL